MIFMTDWHGSTCCSLIIGGARLIHGPLAKYWGARPPCPPGLTPLYVCIHSAYLAFAWRTWYVSGCYGQRPTQSGRWCEDGWFERWEIAGWVDRTGQQTETTPAVRWGCRHTCRYTAGCLAAQSRRTSAVHTHIGKQVCQISHSDILRICAIISHTVFLWAN